MTDSPTSGRHHREARRGVIGPGASAPPVLFATAPVVPTSDKTGIDYDPGRAKDRSGPGSCVEDFGRN